MGRRLTDSYEAVRTIIDDSPDGGGTSVAMAFQRDVAIVAAFTIALAAGSVAQAEPRARDLAVGGFVRVICANAVRDQSCVIAEELALDMRYLQVHAGVLQGPSTDFHGDYPDVDSSTLTSLGGDWRLGFNVGLDAGSPRFWLRRNPRFGVALSVRGSLDADVLFFVARLDRMFAAGNWESTALSLVNTYGPDLWLTFGRRFALTARLAAGFSANFADGSNAVRFAVDARLGFAIRF
ncbi:MAG: hypothetical protein JWM53_636 [bacterium]|nr:hypothetical protein [bacterium]